MPRDAPFRTVLALMVSAMAILAVQDALVKVISESVSIWQFNIVRSILVLGMLTAYCMVVRPVGGLSLAAPGWALLRAALMVSAFVLFYGALPFVSLSQAAATFFTAPLFTAMIGMALGGERVDAMRVGALAAGFSGVLLIVRPWSDAPEVMTLLALGGALCYAGASALTRLRLRDDPVIALTGIQNILYLQVALAALVAIDMLRPTATDGFAFLLTGWRSANGIAWALLAVTAITQTVGAILLTRVYQVGESSRVAPLEYVYLPMVAGIDLLIWGTIPDAMTFAGMALIVLAGMLVRGSGEATTPRNP